MPLDITKKTSAGEIAKFYNTDLTGKVVIVTGSNSGIGLETARILSFAGAKVIVPCRTLEKANDSIEQIKQTVPKTDPIPLQLDLSDFASIRAFAKSFLDLDLPLHILINNAGHFLLVDLLTEKTKASAPSRIVIVSSSGQCQFLSSQGIEFDHLNAEKKFSAMGASTNIFCAVSPDVVKGEFYVNNAINTALLNEQANNEELAKKLWDISVRFLTEKKV